METKIKEQAELNAALYEERFRKVAKVAFKEGAEWHRKETSWISVEERLPEPKRIGAPFSEDVLVCVQGSQGKRFVTTDCYDIQEQCWFEMNGICAKVTHWMPLIFP